MKKYIIPIIAIGIACNAIILIFHIDGQAMDRLRAIKPGWFLLTILLAHVPNLLNAVRVTLWTYFLNRPIGYREALHTVVSSELGASLSPTAIGGGPVKVGMLVKNGLSLGQGTSLTALSSLEDMLFFAISMPLSYFMIGQENLSKIHNILGTATNMLRPIIIYGLGIFAIIFLSWMLWRRFFTGKSFKVGSHLEKIQGTIRKAFGDFKNVFQFIASKGKKRFCLTMSITALQWIARYSIITLLITSFGVPIDPFLFYFLQTVVFGIMNFIPTPGAAAGAEAMFFLIYAPFLPMELIGILTIGWRFFTYYLMLISDSLIIATLNFMPLPSRSRMRLTNY